MRSKASPPKRTQEVVTFKVDAALLRLMRGMPNRSDFIRTALLAALNNLCPLCKGTGMLGPKIREHWDEFAKDHGAEHCNDCRELTIVCRDEKA